MLRPSRISIAALALVALAASHLPAQDRGTRLVGYPSVGATQVAFAYANDIWIVSRDGGDARRLTSFPGSESYPFISPDGKTVAFTGEYGGNLDVYVVPIEGGEPRRLTWHPGVDLVKGWSNDGTRVLFSSGRTSAPTPYYKFWSIALAGGLPEPLPLPRVNRGQLSADGSRFVYQLVAKNDLEWRNYRGGQAQPIRLLDMKTLDETRLPWNGSDDTDPVWVGDRIYFLSDRDNLVNLYRYDPASKQVAQVTKYKDFDIKNLASGAGVLAYEQGGYIHLFDPKSNNDQQLVIHVRGDLPWTMPQWKDLGSSIVRGSLSPTGVRALFEARGDVFTVPMDKGDSRNLTHSSHAADRLPIWSPDGKSIAWFSDASGEYQLMIGDQAGLESPRAIKLEKPTFYFTPVWSPDSRSIAYTDEGLNLWIVDVATGVQKKVDTDQYMVPTRTIDPSWSPDSKWVAYAKRLPSQYHAIMVYSVADGRTRQLTDGLSDAVQPVWDANGKYLYFLGSTDFGLNTGWLDMSSYERAVTRAIYFAVLSANDPSPLLPQSDEEPVAAPRASADSARGAAPVNVTPPTVRIDFDDISQRILALDVPPRNYVDLKAAGTGVLFYAEAVANQPGVTVHRYDLKTRKTQPYMAGVGVGASGVNFAVSANGKKVLYRVQTAWHIADAERAPTPGAPPTPGIGVVNTALRAHIDPVAEWRQMFRESWRLERDFFYVPNYHGVNWDNVYKMYEPWLAYVGHRSDLTNLLDIMQGELAVGHSFVFEGDTPEIDRPSIGLLGADVEVSQGRYRLKRIYSGENWNPELRAPLSAPGVKVSVGDYILAVNGQELAPPTSFYALFEGMAGKQTVLTVNDRPTMAGSRTITVVPVPSEQGLRSRAWVEDNRRFVDKASNGRLAYVYLPNTSGAGYSYFNRYYFAQQDRQGAVIDERFNGGGSAADYMIDIMSRKLQGYFNNPVGERKLFTVPQAGIWGPKVMIINDAAGSGGDLLPFLFKQAKLGPIVGTNTWGGLVGIWDTQQLLDGGGITNPRGGFINVAGKWDVENVGVAPDIEVEMSPKAVNDGHDPQLERAVQEAVRLLNANPPKIMTEPAPPVRAKRP